MKIIDIHSIFHNKQITYKEAELILYDFKRHERFEVFIALYEATLKNDLTTAFKVFREAYCASDHIFKQIKNSKSTFDLKMFLNFLKNNRVDFMALMTDREKKYYHDLPDRVTIYRGINEAEHISKNYGISWSLSEDTAMDYIYFDKNEVEKGEGGIIDLTVDKKDILTVFSVHRDLEIIYIYDRDM
ncbi:hypothetical protein EG347_06575 [Chryseobacterium sp. G0186]|uniref:hypothetical protein n=1 Tax=Chryseobacterium sp. G0186 TaxID=2487064 RepID=UPI000F50A9BD|nr:hypothetical protein [Chryseobacterium sp. G0186]AZA77190.1 hypothetical protein EG347_06575 [Chryseobacterium sp. G0186]